ncbi:hypothetical protein, partial [Eubacterium sp.]|uniref:hypothetical protein n=1 Tax=Eubacterium sp. TaxID=142586 RepID=UPI003F024F06
SNCADLFLIKAQKRRNTFCIPSVLTQRKGKSANLNHGSDCSSLSLHNLQGVVFLQTAISLKK